MGRLTAKQVENAGSGMHADGDGLYLQVGGDGARSWVYRFKLRGKERYLGLGSASVVTLKRARELADDARRLKAEGIDPIERRRQQEAASKAHAAKAVTFKEAATQFVASKEVGWKNAKHRQQWTNTLVTYVYPVFGHLEVGEIDTTLVMKVLQPIWATKPETASRIRGRIEVVLDAAKTQGQRSGENPARWKGHLANLLPAKRKVLRVRHHSALPYAQIPAFMQALRAHPSISARALHASQRLNHEPLARPSHRTERPWTNWTIWTIPPDQRGSVQIVQFVQKSWIAEYDPPRNNSAGRYGGWSPDAAVATMGRITAGGKGVDGAPDRGRRAASRQRSRQAVR